MTVTHAMRRTLPVCALALAVTATPALAFQPSVQVRDEVAGHDLAVTDLAARGEIVALSTDVREGSFRSVGFDFSTDGGATWDGETISGPFGAFESQSTICDGHAVLVFRSIVDDPVTEYSIRLAALPTDGITAGTIFDWTAPGAFRKPDVACAANKELAGAWFQKDGGDWDVKVKTRVVDGTNSSPQSFDLGRGTPGRGLAIATSSDRVYVAWFLGDKLKLRRFSIGSTASHSLTSLGTSTIATLSDGMYPEIGADGDRVILAYMDRADLKVRRSTNKGRSFGPARTLRDEPFPSEIGAFPTTVAVKGSRVAIGAVEIGGIETLVGKGLGYRSTDGGSSYTRVSTHSSGRTVAGLVKVGSSYKYAEAWDQSISDPDPEEVRFRRQ